MSLLQTHNLTLTVAGRTLVSGLELSIGEAENWAILGANGSGKTTLLHTLAGLRPSTGGHVELKGRAIDDWPTRLRAQQMGLLFQETTSAFPSTVLETVLTGRHPHLRRWQWETPDDENMAKKAIETVGLTGLDHRFLSTLSGGEHRRVEIAALLAQNPPLCLLDEPTNHLDLHFQIRILSLFSERTWLPAHANLFVLHDVNSAIRFCTHALLLFGDGDCVHGRANEVMTQNLLERVYGCRMRQISDGDTSLFVPA